MPIFITLYGICIFSFFPSSCLVSIKVLWRLQSRTFLCKISPSNPHRQLSLSFQTPSKQVWLLMHFICLLLIYDLCRVPGQDNASSVGKVHNKYMLVTIPAINSAHSSYFSHSEWMCSGHSRWGFISIQQSTLKCCRHCGLKRHLLMCGIKCSTYSPKKFFSNFCLHK